MSVPTNIDLNCDMGESFGMYKMGLDEEVIKYITSASIACGFHAGDPMWMRHTVRLAEEHDVAVGAHPGYPDLKGFGRRNMTVTPEEAKNDIMYQMGALQAFTKSKRLQHVKPHGAMYNRAVDDEALAHAICEAVLEMDPDTILLALAGSPWARIAKEMGVRVAREIFADRALNADGSLVSRSQPAAVIHDVEEVVERSLMMVTERQSDRHHWRRDRGAGRKPVYPRGHAWCRRHGEVTQAGAGRCRRAGSPPGPTGLNFHSKNDRTPPSRTEKRRGASPDLSGYGRCNVRRALVHAGGRPGFGCGIGRRHQPRN